MQNRWLNRFRNARARVNEQAQAQAVRPEYYVGDDAVKNERIVREGFVFKAKRSLSQIPLAHETVALYFCLLDSKTPLWVKGTVAAALAYFILPLDAVPDLLPLVGFSDDAGVLAAAFAAVSSHITDEHRARARDWMAVEIPTTGVVQS